MKRARSQGIEVKKKYGQHFLRQVSVVHRMIDMVSLDKSSSVFEIGCGDGFLTEAILKEPIARLWVFEIDPEWAEYVSKKCPDPRLQMHLEDILRVDFSMFETHKPWVLLANLPYQITFPILYKLQANRHLLQEGVIMVQEEVAQKIVKTSGRGYGYPSVFFQYYFEWKLLDKIPPGAFFPPPKIFSRTLYFKPKKEVRPIKQEADFWKFIKLIFHQPRRTLRNNLMQTHYDLSKFPQELLNLRAQQLGIDDFLAMWEIILSLA